MKTWSKDELRKVAESEELDISTMREDGVTYRAPTTIWSVAVDDALYVRAGNGLSSRWYRAAMREKAGRIAAAGVTKAVSFEPIGGAINDRVDAAYREKYRSSPYVDDMLGPTVRAATLRVMPRETEQRGGSR
jgi:hypothetical protein